MGNSILGNIFGNRRNQGYHVQHIWPEGMPLQFSKDPKYLTLVFFDDTLYRKSDFFAWPGACSIDASDKGYNLVNFRNACEVLSTRFLKYVCPGSAGLPFSFDEFKENAKAVFGRKLPKAVIIQYHDGEFVYYDFSQSKSRDILPDVLNLIYALPWLKEQPKGPVIRYRMGTAQKQKDSKVQDQDFEKEDEEILYSMLEDEDCFSPITQSSESPVPPAEEASEVRFRITTDSSHRRPSDIRFSKTTRETAVDENETLIKEFLSKYEQLRKIGISDEYIQSLLNYERKASRLRITSQGRLFLVDYDNAEVKMDALSKAVYLLYLKHPEGIRFKALMDYSDELFHLYSKLSNRSDLDALMASVGRLVDPEDNSINEKTSKANRAFNAVMDESAAKAYYIEGAKGEDKSIDIDRSLIIWEL